jgi:hypothetical protein
MSTFTAVGPALNLDGPLPVAPEYRLLAAPGVLQADNNRVYNSVNVWGYPTGTPFLWDICSAGTDTKSSESDWDQALFSSVTAYFPIVCSTITAAPQEFAARAEAALDATFSFAVEQALSQGVAGSTNPFFGDANLTQLGGGTITAQAGLNYLENAIGETGRAGMIHATPGTISAWNFVNLLTDNGEGYIETANGTPVVSGGGYIGTDPSGKVGSTPSTGIEWAFATGPVKVYAQDGPSLRVSEYVDRSINEIVYRAERDFVALWDTSLQSGVLIDWTP